MQNYTPKIVSAGHICLDITPVFPSHSLHTPEQLLIPGRLIQMEGVNVHPGGSAANTGMALQMLGADTTLMGKIGTDEFGVYLLEWLKRKGMDKGMCISEDCRTSYSVVLAPPGIDRIFLHDSGANDTYSIEDLDFHLIAQADHFHFGYPPLMKKMYEQDGAMLVEIFRRVKALGLSTSLDMAMVDEASPAGLADWKRILTGVLPYVDFFVPSAEEICWMLDRSRYQRWVQLAGGKEIVSVIDVKADLEPLSNQLIEMGAKVVLLKCGTLGLYLQGAPKITSTSNFLGTLNQWENVSILERPYLAAQVASATGAGDTSIAAFLLSVLSGESPEWCMKLASATGTCCVEQYDALSGLQSFDFLKTKIRNGWSKIT